MLLSLLLACADPPPGPATVVIVSWGTARADALSGYADTSHWGAQISEDLRPKPATPAADRLMAEGVRFRWAFSSGPTTLGAHATLFSGFDAHEHRVVRDGYPLPEGVPLLAERLAGWDRLAAVGSPALRPEMGLARGFSVYDAPEGPAWDAAEVTRRALAAVDARADKGGDLLLFAHYADARAPWTTAPAEVKARFAAPGYAGPVDGSMASMGYLAQSRLAGRMLLDDVRQARALYLAQVAWADQQTGALLEGLRERGLLADALVVLVSDHGESLDEHARYPYTHGPDVDLMNVQVPLVVWGSGRFELPAGAVVQRQARLQDVGTTLLALLGQEGLLGRGEDLSPLWQGFTPPAPPAFAEATRPLAKESRERWNNADFERAVILDGHMLIASPWTGDAPQLYQVAPGQPAASDRSRAASLALLLAAWDAAAPRYRPPPPGGAQALGYVE